MANRMVKVKRETIQACMTCPLCRKLFRDATTISECLHTCEFLSLFLSLSSFVSPDLVLYFFQIFCSSLAMFSDLGWCYCSFSYLGFSWFDLCFVYVCIYMGVL